MIDQFLQGYDTVDNYLRCYGGPVEVKEPVIDDNGLLTFSFSRPVVFPTSFLQDFNSSYVEQVPSLTPTDEELKEINFVFEENQAT